VTDVTDRGPWEGAERPITADEEAEIERIRIKFEASNGGAP
jgi:hypothetical protein